jgi:hypothetical protein
MKATNHIASGGTPAILMTSERQSASAHPETSRVTEFGRAGWLVKALAASRLP